MNPFEMVVMIVAIVCIASVLKGRRLSRHDRRNGMLDVTPRPQDEAETRRLREEVTQLKQRIQVLERIAVEKENSLTREIEQLRDR